MMGRVVSTICGVYNVMVNDKTLLCKPRGVFRHKNMKLQVGDFVEVNEELGIIEDIYERKNSLFRPNVSNIDLGIVVMSLENPTFSSLLMDKFLTLLNTQNIEPLIVLTKVDLAKDKSDSEKICEQYGKLGIKVIPYSKRTKEGLDQIKDEIRTKTIAFMGQTGVGKSSLINLIDENYQREIGEYSTALGRGKHQTKEVVLLPYLDGFIADTPGFSSLELPLIKDDLAKFFPGFSDKFLSCKFTNCLHLKEKDCAVRKAVEEGLIPLQTYENYVQISNELLFRKEH
ncbi:MAG: ribosome small subunit-dependent GTPase A [Bacilli bacterium]